MNRLSVRWEPALALLVVARPLGLDSLAADRAEVAIPERSRFHDKGANGKAGSRAFPLIYRQAEVAVALLFNLGGVPSNLEAASHALARPFLASSGYTAPATSPQGL